jgi:hypothetical protein
VVATGILKLVAWLTLIGSLIIGVPTLGDALATRGSIVGAFVPLSILLGGAATWGLLIAFVDMVRDVKRLVDHFTPAPTYQQKIGAPWHIPEPDETP